jgi:hypothetical protein
LHAISKEQSRMIAIIYFISLIFRWRMNNKHS